MGTMKRSLMVLAAVFAMASTSAVAGDVLEGKTDTLASKAVPMTDEQLDQITAAGAMVAIAISNPRNAMRLDSNGKGNQAVCINCGFLPEGDGTFVLLGVVNKGHPLTDPIMKCLGRCPF